MSPSKIVILAVTFVRKKSLKKGIHAPFYAYLMEAEVYVMFFPKRNSESIKNIINNISV